jgi:hypothetical protein
VTLPYKPKHHRRIIHSLCGNFVHHAINEVATSFMSSYSTSLSSYQPIIVCHCLHPSYSKQLPPPSQLPAPFTQARLHSRSHSPSLTSALNRHSPSHPHQSRPPCVMYHLKSSLTPAVSHRHSPLEGGADHVASTGTLCPLTHASRPPTLTVSPAVSVICLTQVPRSRGARGPQSRLRLGPHTNTL